MTFFNWIAIFQRLLYEHAKESGCAFIEKATSVGGVSLPQYSQLKRASVRRVTARELKNIAMLSLQGTSQWLLCVLSVL